MENISLKNTHGIFYFWFSGILISSFAFLTQILFQKRFYSQLLKIKNNSNHNKIHPKNINMRYKSFEELNNDENIEVNTLYFDKTSIEINQNSSSLKTAKKSLNIIKDPEEKKINFSGLKARSRSVEETTGDEETKLYVDSHYSLPNIKIKCKK